MRIPVYGYRYLNPELGRWPSRDPIAEDGGLNLYAFVGNDPISRTDAFGLSTYEGFAGYVKVRRDIRPDSPIGIVPHWRDLGGSRTGHDGRPVYTAAITAVPEKRVMCWCTSTGCDIWCTVVVHMEIHYNSQLQGRSINWAGVYGHEQRHVLSMGMEADFIANELMSEPVKTGLFCGTHARRLERRYTKKILDMYKAEVGHSNRLSPSPRVPYPPIGSVPPPVP